MAIEIQPKLLAMRRLTLFIFNVLMFSQLSFGQFPGCTDPDAWNYLDAADLDDGSCLHVSDCGEDSTWRAIKVSLNQVSVGSTVIVSSLDDQDTLMSTEIWNDAQTQYLGFCLPSTGCFNLDVYLPETNPWVFEGSVMYFNSTPLYNDLGQNAFLGYLQHSPGLHYRIILNADNTDCGYAGCMDPEAENYWSLANINYNCVFCEGNDVKVSEEQVFGVEKSWSVYQNEVYIDGASFDGQSDAMSEIICLPDGCYQFKVTDNQGWYFDKIHLEYPEGDTLFSVFLSEAGTVEVPFGINTENCEIESEVYGCTNPLASNYSSLTTIDNGTCDLQNGNCAISFDIEVDVQQNSLAFTPNITSTEYPLYIYWDFGDGSDINDSWWTSHEYDSAGPFDVCIWLYAISFFESEPYCYDTYSVTVDPIALGLNPLNGFIVYLNEEPDGLADNHLSESLMIYPNPAKEQLACEMIAQDVSFERIRILTSDGRLVLEKNVTFNSYQYLTIEVSELDAGYYFIIFENETQQAIKQFVKE